MRKFRKITLIIFITVSYTVFLNSFITAQDASAAAQTAADYDVGIDQKLGDHLPMDLIFQNSEGDSVKLGELINAPVLMALIYYECPGICSPLLTELASQAERIKLVPGKDFEIITVSIAPAETPEVAAHWKKTYFLGMKGDFPESAWHFLVGDSLNIKKLADAVGYHFTENKDSTYLHPGALISISPKGKISRYIFGIQYNPFDLKMALIEAEAGKTNPAITKVLQLCFSYDPSGRGYSLNVTRIVGSIMLLGVGIFLTVLIVKKNKKKGAKTNG